MIKPNEASESGRKEPKSLKDFEEMTHNMLKAHNLMRPGLEGSAYAYASALYTLYQCNKVLATLDGITITRTTKQGGETCMPHPVFKIMQDAHRAIAMLSDKLGLVHYRLH